MELALSRGAAYVLCALRAAGYEAYVVGGCVRDSLLGRRPGDWDVTTSALPEETKAVFSGAPVIGTGVRHGTVAVLVGGEPSRSPPTGWTAPIPTAAAPTRSPLPAASGRTSPAAISR